MRTLNLGVAIAGALLVLGVTSAGCVADRPARNGVFNENQYVRKDFLIQGVDANGAATNQGDPGWLMRATVTETSTPNLLGSAIGIFGGLQAEVDLVRFRVTQDKLQMLNMVQLSNPIDTGATAPGVPGNNGTTAAPNTVSTTEEVVNAWPVTNVDLKYQVNLDGETTNFYQENQELDWQVRQWVKLQFDKNDFSDLAPMGFQANDLIAQCADVANASATLVTDSFVIDGADDTDISNDYMEFTVQVSLPMKFTDQTCLTAYGPMLQNSLLVNHTAVTVNLKYSFERAVATPKYVPWILAEKDKIHTKYGPFLFTTFNRDNDTGLIAANQYVGRFDPTKPIVWYFDRSIPENYKSIFRNKGNAADPTTIQGATNALLAKAHAVEPTTTAQLQFLEYNDGGIVRNYGDIRYNFLRWASDQDLQDSFAGVTMPGFDPRNGEIVNEGIEFNDFAVLNYYNTRIDSFLTSVGAGLSDPIPSGSCTPGQTLPVVTLDEINTRNATDTLFTKMQQYLQLNSTDPNNNHLGPSDFAATANETDPDFLNAYLALAPYELFADPAMNLFVTPEGQQGVFGPAAVWQDLQQETTFQQNAALINAGKTPYVAAEGTPGVAAAAEFMNTMRAATNAHLKLPQVLAFNQRNVHMDAPGSFSLETVMEQDSRQCVNGQWESAAQWEQHIIDTYWQQVLWHEFGHSMGLEHNFMGNVDQYNFTPQTSANGTILTDSAGHNLYNMYSSSIMEYSASPARLAWTQGWGAYDVAAITWIYANNGVNTASASATKAAPLTTRSGQVDATYPYNDPYGFCPATGYCPTTSTINERQFLRCDENHLTYSPLCRQGDLGVTPSEIMANEINNYEWTYQWRNFRNYLKVWNESAYANSVAGIFTDNRRFLSQWAFDWSPGDLEAELYRIGITPPASAPSAVDYYSQLTNKFFVEMSKTNQMIVAFDEAVIQESAGERPYATVYDDFFGDETQQGIILDKFFAMQGFVGLWESNNYDQNQAGSFISSWGDFDYYAGSAYQSVAETALSAMIGSQYDAYTYFIPTAVALFAQDSHSPSYIAGGGRIAIKDWIGGWTFNREQDFVDYFKNIAVESEVCTDFSSCTYDVTDPQAVPKAEDTQIFTGPDGLNYIYMYMPDRNQWVLARQDRNIVMWRLIEQYNLDLIGNVDDGTGPLYGYEYQIKYTIDAYEAYEQTSETANATQ